MRCALYGDAVRAFSALAALARVFIGPPAGYLVADVGWPVFFMLTFVASLPALGLVLYLAAPIRALDRPGADGRAAT